MRWRDLKTLVAKASALFHFQVDTDNLRNKLFT